MAKAARRPSALRQQDASDTPGPDGPIRTEEWQPGSPLASAAPLGDASRQLFQHTPLPTGRRDRPRCLKPSAPAGFLRSYPGFRRSAGPYDPPDAAASACSSDEGTPRSSTKPNTRRSRRQGLRRPPNGDDERAAGVPGIHGGRGAPRGVDGVKPPGSTRRARWLSRTWHTPLEFLLGPPLDF
jgi:hypothetical protein